VSFLYDGSDGEAGFVQVDELLTRVERVHEACELAGQNIGESTSRLMGLVGPQFQGDPAAAYGELMVSLERCQKQEKALRKDSLQMQTSAKRVFARWEKDLEAFTSDSMRSHSAKRLAGARKRLDTIVQTVGPALERYAAYNETLSDHARYLGNDFSSEAVKLIDKEVRDLAGESARLGKAFERCTAACQNYVRKASPRGQGSPKARRNL